MEEKLQMPSKDLSTEKNEAYWTERESLLRKTLFEDVQRYVLDFEENKQGHYCLSVASTGMIPDGIDLIMIGELERAKKHFELAVQYTKEAIRSDDYGDYRREPTEGRILGGKYRQLRTLQLTKWLLTGNRHEELLKEALGYFKRWIDFNVRGMSGGIGKNPLVLIADLVEAGELEEAKRYYERYAKPGKLALPRTTLYEPSRAQLMYLIANAFTDKPQLKEQTQTGVERLYQGMTDWGGQARQYEYQGVTGDSWLQYAYIRGKYFTGITDPTQLIRNMRHRV